MSMIVVPHLILLRGDDIFLSRRAVTQKFGAGHWHCVSGSIEVGETPMEALRRETTEEIGITLYTAPKLVAAVSVTERDCVDINEMFYCTSLFFLAELEDGQVPFNREPLKQDLIGWFPLRALPCPIVESVKVGIECFLSGKSYAEFRHI